LNIIQIDAKSILRKSKKIDSWFISNYGMNLYRGCSHNCSYCDGRAEKYQVNGEFGKEVAVKMNAIEILRRELDPARKRIPFKSGFFFVGGGVCDSYEPLEKKYQLTRQALELLEQFNHPVHLLTKSTLIERDLELIKRINNKSRAIVSMSFSSVDDTISKQFEPGVSPPSGRLKVLKKFKDAGIACGMFLLPVIPFVTDSAEKISETLKAAREIDLDYVIFGGMTLKSGRQKDHFYNILRQYNPDLIPEYQKIYQSNEWGNAATDYYGNIHKVYREALKNHPIAGRIPANIFCPVLDPPNLVIILLEHIDFYLKLRGQKSPYGYGAYQISKLKESIDLNFQNSLEQLQLNRSVRFIAREILGTGQSALYNELTKDFN
jgi:DNA repair photolyase